MDSYVPTDFYALFDESHKALVRDGRTRAVIVAYEQALSDPKAKIPTYLHAAIEALRRG